MAEYKCPYCGARFSDAITRSQHVRKCPDGPPRSAIQRSSLPPVADAALQTWLRGAQLQQASYAATQGRWAGVP